jgi:hypothetical protein
MITVTILILIKITLIITILATLNIILKADHNYYINKDHLKLGLLIILCNINNTSRINMQSLITL